MESSCPGESAKRVFALGNPGIQVGDLVGQFLWRPRQ
jgi:hypothetical protein